MGIIGSLLEARAGDEITTLAKPATWLTSFFLGGDTNAGVKVNEHTVLSLSTVWACVRAISEDIAKLPIKVTEEQADGSMVLRPQSPVWKLLNRRPNADLIGPLTFRETLTAWCLLWGNGYAEIERDKTGVPLNLWPMRPDRTTVERVNDRIRYVYTGEKGDRSILDQADVLHIRGLGFDGLVGYSVVSKARDSMGLSVAAEMFGGAFFRNGARPSGAFTHPGKLSPEATTNLRKSIEDLYSGAKNAARPILLQEGMTWNSMTIPPDDAQFLQTRQFQAVEVCRWFRMKPHKVADLTNATFSNIEHQDLEYVGDSLQGWMTRWEQEIWLKLFAGNNERYQARHNAAGLLRGDLKSRYEAYAIGRQWGFRSVNEIKRLEDENPIGEDGDQFLVPANMTLPKKVGQTPPAPIGNPPVSGGADKGPTGVAARADLRAVAASFTPAFEDAIARVLRVEADKARRALKKGELVTWHGTFWGDHLDHVRGAVMLGVETLARTVRSLGVDVPDAWIAAASSSIAAAHVARSRSQLQPSAAADSIEATLRAWEATRAAADAAITVELLGAELAELATKTTPKEPSP